MTHEPEVAAVVYLAGTLDTAERERFEEHLLACEECWHEVQMAHRGRALAESLREVAPQPLGERVRASVAAASRSDRRRRRRPLAAAIAATVLAVVAGGILVAQRPAGQHVTLLLADRSFPEAVGASHPPGTAIWVAEVDGVAVLCADRPSPSLLVGPDRTEVLLAASQLGLH